MKQLIDPTRMSGDQKLIVIVMVLIFVLVVLGLVTVIVKPDSDTNVIIPLVSLGVLALGNFAQKPSFPVPFPTPPDPITAKNTQAIAALEPSGETSSAPSSSPAVSDDATDAAKVHVAIEGELIPPKADEGE